MSSVRVFENEGTADPWILSVLVSRGHSHSRGDVLEKTFFLRLVDVKKRSLAHWSVADENDAQGDYDVEEARVFPPSPLLPPTWKKRYDRRHNPS